MTLESYKILLAQTAAAIYGGYLVCDMDSSKDEAINSAKILLTKCGIEEPKE